MDLANMIEQDNFHFNPIDSFNAVASTSTSTPTTEFQTNGGVKRAASEAEIDELDSPKGTKAARKRNRTALSCSECKRRKIKCDRTVPCASCCKRGEQATCVWAENVVIPAPQPFVLVSEHEILKKRVATLEEFISRHYSSSTTSHEAPYDAYQLVPTHHPPDLTPQAAEVEEEEVDSDVEDAAQTLEELGIGRKLIRVEIHPRKSSMNFPPPVTPLPSILPMTPLSAAMQSLIVPIPEPRLKSVLDYIFSTLPTSKPVMDFLVTNYFTNAEWAWKLHHKPTFLAEYEAYGVLMQQGRKYEIDALWLAILCQTLCLSVNSLEQKVESPLVNISEQDLETLPNKLFDAAQRCLEVADWVGKPRIRTLQTIVLFAPLLLFDGSASTGERHQTYLGAAIRIAQQLGLHKLGHDPLTMPPLDPSLPAGISSLRREIPIRLFYTLLFLDYMGIRSKPSLPPNEVDCALPGNYHDSDLLPDGIIAPRSEDQSTDVTFEIIKYKVATQQRRLAELVSSGISLEYETIVELDKGYRSIADTLPPDLRHDYEAPIGESLAVTWKRSMVTQTIFNRMMRLHRPFMTRGYKEAKYRHSTDSALEAARMVLVCQQALNSAPLLKAGFQLLHSQGAAIVLLMNIWTHFRESLEDEDYRLIQGVIPFFERSLSSRHLAVRKIAQQNLQTLRLLLEALEQRRDAATARKAAGGTWESEVEAESYGKLLKRIGNVVISTAIAANTTNSNTPTINSFPLTATSSIGLNSLLDPVLLPSSEWDNFPSGIGFDSSSLLDTSYPPIGFSDIDLSSLSGPEYADSAFEWGNFNQFSALGNF